MSDKRTMKACPFCGGFRIVSGTIRDGQEIRCLDCTASVHAFHPDALEHARALWNQRTLIGP